MVLFIAGKRDWPCATFRFLVERLSAHIRGAGIAVLIGGIATKAASPDSRALVAGLCDPRLGSIYVNFLGGSSTSGFASTRNTNARRGLKNRGD